MIKALNKTRSASGKGSLSGRILSVLLILLLGAAMGAAAKFSEAVNDSILPEFLQNLGLADALTRPGAWLLAAVLIAVFAKAPLKAAINVFAFFAGMLISVCAWGSVYSGGLPGFGVLAPLLIITVVSPFAAFFCWYGRGRGALAVGTASVLIAIFCVLAFKLSVPGFGVKHLPELIFWIACIGALFKAPKQSLFSFLISVPVALALEYTGLLALIGVG